MEAAPPSVSQYFSEFEKGLGEAALRRCILGGIATLTGLVTVVVAACVYVPALDAATAAPAFRTGALVTALVGLGLLVSLLFVRGSHAYQRLAHGVVGLAVAALLVVAAHAVRTKAVVVTTLAAAALLTALAAYAGTQLEDASAMGLPLFVGVLVLIVAGALNGLVFHAHWLETLLSLAAIAVFTAYSVYDANVFVKKRACAHDCCEEGVFSLFLNFANVATSLMDLNAGQ